MAGASGVGGAADPDDGDVGAAGADAGFEEGDDVGGEQGAFVEDEELVLAALAAGGVLVGLGVAEQDQGPVGEPEFVFAAVPRCAEGLGVGEVLGELGEEGLAEFGVGAAERADADPGVADAFPQCEREGGQGFAAAGRATHQHRVFGGRRELLLGALAAWRVGLAGEVGDAGGLVAEGGEHVDLGRVDRGRERRGERSGGHAASIAPTWPWLRQACPVNSTVVGALIGAGGAVLGGVLVFFGVQWQARWQARREERRARDQAIAELLAAAVDLITGVQAIRAAYERRTSWRVRLRVIAAVFAAFGTAFGGEESLTLDTVLNWRKEGPMLDRILAVDRELNEDQRIIALDLTTVLLPRTNRFYAAVAVLTLGPDKAIARATRELAPVVAEFTEMIAAKRRKYSRARSRAEKALAKFRSVADQRR